ncbi:MAG: nucleotidyltransferase family protein [Thermodesulfobacteriota bacterium]
MSSGAPGYADITAVILAGGKGTRLRDAVSDVPKVLARVLGRPFITYLLDQLDEAGLKKVVLSTGYMNEMVSAELGDSYKDLKLSYSVEETPLGTGGGLRKALGLLDSELALIMNGDSYADLDLKAFLEWFYLRDRKAAMALASVDDNSRYGSVEVSEDGAISAFKEKSAGNGKAGGHGGRGGLINAGVYLVKRSLIAEIKEGAPYSLERELFPSLISKEDGLWGYRFDGAFIDIGTPESYAMAESFFADD